MLAEFGTRTMTDQRGKAGGAEPNSQDDAVFASEKDMSHLLRRARNALDEQPFSKQRLGRIGHFRPLIASITWVLEVGMKKWCRLTTSIVTGW